MFVLLSLASGLAASLLLPPSRAADAQTPISIAFATKYHYRSVQVDITPHFRGRAASLLDVTLLFDGSAIPKSGVSASMQISAPQHDVTYSMCSPRCRTKDSYFYRSILGTTTTQTASLPYAGGVNFRPGLYDGLTFESLVASPRPFASFNPVRMLLSLPPITAYDSDLDLLDQVSPVKNATPLSFTVSTENAPPYTLTGGGLDVDATRLVGKIGSIVANTTLSAEPSAIDITGLDDTHDETDQNMVFISGILLGVAATAVIAALQELVRVLSERTADAEAAASSETAAA